MTSNFFLSNFDDFDDDEKNEKCSFVIFFGNY